MSYTESYLQVDPEAQKLAQIAVTIAKTRYTVMTSGQSYYIEWTDDKFMYSAQVIWTGIIPEYQVSDIRKIGKGGSQYA